MGEYLNHNILGNLNALILFYLAATKLLSMISGRNELLSEIVIAAFKYKLVKCAMNWEISVSWIMPAQLTNSKKPNIAISHFWNLRNNETK